MKLKVLKIFPAILLFLSLVPVFGQKSRPKPKPTPKATIPASLTPRQIVDKVLPSLVLVVTHDLQGETLGQGSGFIYKPGLVVTNLHVLSRASSAFVKTAGGKINYKVTGVVGIDIRRDLCILRIDDATLPSLVLSNSTKPSVGDEVLVFGNPKGLEGTVSKGIVSGLRKDADLIQIDASISPGSSGGPIVDGRGQVIGVAVSSLVSGQNLNFGIPIQFLKAIPEKQFASSDPGLKEIDDLIGYRPSVSVAGAGAVAISDRESKSLKGPVKSYISTNSFFQFDEKIDKYIEEPSPTMIAKEIFDEYGNLIEEWKYHYGDLAWKYLYSYDEFGFIKSFIWEPASGTEGKREIYQLTPAESITKKMGWERGTAGVHIFPESKVIYDSSGSLIESTLSAGSITSARKYSYDQNGNEIESKSFIDGQLSRAWRSTYELDINGNWIKCVRTNYDSKWPSLGYTPDSITYRQITYFR